MDKNILRKLLQNLQIVMRCPKCGKPYNIDEINLKGFSGNTYMLQMECSNCHMPVQANISISNNLSEVSSKPQNIFEQMPKIFQKPITPPRVYQKPKKIEKRNHKPITIDEIIDFHEFLKSYNGRIDQI